ncbi:MAG TPA: DUF2911 domain-containing protein [Cyclobacteriaceae bacterium]|nr:DUF2911 domain-containing protein [Cyclobacteriaceae bacterium]
MRKLLSLILLFGTFSLFAQEAVQPRPSPLAVVSCKYKDSYLKIVYSQPHKHGREVFGKLVPFGQVWRLGANEATELTISREVFIDSHLLSAGTYAVFAIPEKDKWTIIFNSETGQWGSYNYNKDKDVLRIERTVQTLPGELVYEPFTISIDQKNNKADIVITWDKTTVSFGVDFIEPKP